MLPPLPTEYPRWWRLAASATSPCGQTGPGAGAVGTAWVARQPCGRGGDKL